MTVLPPFETIQPKTLQSDYPPPDKSIRRDPLRKDYCVIMVAVSRHSKVSWVAAKPLRKRIRDRLLWRTTEVHKLDNISKYGVTKELSTCVVVFHVGNNNAHARGSAAMTMCTQRVVEVFVYL